MLVLQLPSRQERQRLGDSGQIRSVVGSELSESERREVVYLGQGVLGFSNAPTLPDQAASQAFDAVAQSLADRLGIDRSLIDGLSHSEVEDHLLERHGGDQDRVDELMSKWFNQ